MGLRYSTCLDPNDPQSELNDKLLFKTRTLTHLHNAYQENLAANLFEQNNEDKNDEDEEEEDNDDDDDDVEEEEDDDMSVYESSNNNRSHLYGSQVNSLSYTTSTRKLLYKTNSKYNINGKAITYSCKNCLTPITASNLIISDNYVSHSGAALLMSNVVNIIYGVKEVKKMTSGTYTVCDIKCHQCSLVVGWKYLARETDRLESRWIRDDNVKIGRFIVEVSKCKVVL